MRTDEPIRAVRKRRRCGWCSEFIEVGASAVRVCGVFEGDFWHDTLHPECHAAEARWWQLPGNQHETRWPEHMPRGSEFEP